MHFRPVRTVAVAMAAIIVPQLAEAAVFYGSELPAHLRDRGNVLPTSLLGTYVGRGQLLVHPFAEYALNSAEEYQGAELGYAGETDYFGRSTEREAGLFVAYGVTENFAVELETTLHQRATLDRADDDTTTGMPDRIESSGAGAFELRAYWRLARESERAPEWFASVEVALPHHRDQPLIGTADLETDLGFGAIKGFSWGTLTARMSISYEAESGEAEVGEFAIEYYKRLSESWRFAAALEGESEDLSVISEVQWQFSPRAFAKFNVGAGLTNTAPDFAPEVGVLFRF